MEPNSSRVAFQAPIHSLMSHIRPTVRLTPADRYCRRAVATGEASGPLSLPFRALAVARPFAEFGGCPKSVPLTANGSAPMGSVDCWPLAIDLTKCNRGDACERVAVVLDVTGDG